MRFRHRLVDGMGSFTWYDIMRATVQVVTARLPCCVPLISRLFVFAVGMRVIRININNSAMTRNACGTSCTCDRVPLCFYKHKLPQVITLTKTDLNPLDETHTKKGY